MVCDHREQLPAADLRHLVRPNRSAISQEPTVSDKSPQKSNAKKQGKTLKEKRAAKVAKKSSKPLDLPRS